jgi:acyl-CoA synthetase (AMP-forming)/AMP-acid ligase II
MVEALALRPSDHVLSCIPLCHSYGLEHGLLAPITAGATVHLMQNFNLAVALRELMQSAITIFPGVPSIFEMLSSLADEAMRFHSLRAAYSAGAVLPQRVAEACLSKLQLRIGQVYGATELGSVTYNDAGSPSYDPASAGAPMRDVVMKILTTSGAPAMTGTEGQLHVRAPSQMIGYVAGDGTELQPDGFFHTGDVARLSREGQLTITGRTKLLIDVGGLKVNPIEVEQLLLDHPQVGECVVVPVPLSETVNRLKAVVVPRQPHEPPAPDELSRFARARLTAYKVPRLFEIRHSLPRTATGKVLRHLVA